MPGNARYFRRRPWWMASCGASDDYEVRATVGFPLGACCGGHTTLGKWFELVKAQRWAGDVDETKGVSDEHRVRTIGCGNLPHSSGASAVIRHSVCDSRLAGCRGLEMGYLWPSADKVAFAMGYRNGCDFAFSFPGITLVVASAMHLARSAPKKSCSRKTLAPRPPPMGAERCPGGRA